MNVVDTFMTAQCYSYLSFNVWRVWRVWRYQRGNQNLYIEEEQTTQWPNEKVQKDKKRSTKHTHKITDRITRTPLKTGDELRCSRLVSCSCSTSHTRRVILVILPLLFVFLRKVVSCTYVVLSLFVFVLCTLCCQFLWIVQLRLPLKYYLTCL
jgi:ABC-type nickel/cobalt efflux system permease component RcnA